MAGTRAKPEPKEPPTEEEQRELEEAARAARVEPAPETLPREATLPQRMVAILAELPAIGKDTRNEQQKFMYRSHDAVLNALNPLLAKYGVFVVPYVLERTTDQRPTRSGSVLYEVNLHVRYTFHGLAGDSLTCSAWGEGTDSGDKSTNKAMTMAFKNVLAQAFAVSTAETVDTDSNTDEETTGRASAYRQDADATLPKPPPNWSEALRRFDRLVASDGDGGAWLEELVEARWGVNSLNDLDSPQRRAALIGFSSALMELETEEGELALRPDLRERIALAFAAKNEGVVLEGPAWRLGPGEDDRPPKGQTKLEVVEQPEQAGRDAPGGDGESGPDADGEEPPVDADGNPITL